jgi:threonine dehydrogenase-like Zn-dependent dehydrogenase
MLAVVKERPEPGVAVVQRPEPTPGPGEALVAVAGTGICGSDLHVYEWVPEYEWLAPHLPTILGHEIGGRVIDANGTAAATRVPVAVRPAITCGRCEACQRGVSQRCPSRIRLGLERDGGLTSYVVAPVENIYAMPSWSAPLAPIVEPLTVAVHAAKRLTLRQGARTAVLGVGAIGLLLVEVLRAHGAGSVVLVGTQADEDGGGLAVGEALGAEGMVVGSGIWDRAADSCEAVIVAAGSASAVADGLRLAQRGAAVLVLGLGIGAASVDVDSAVRRALSLIGAFGSVPADWLDAVSLIASRRVTGEGIVSHELPTADASEAFALLSGRRARKITIFPQEG